MFDVERDCLVAQFVDEVGLPVPLIPGRVERVDDAFRVVAQPLELFVHHVPPGRSGLP